MIAYKTVFWALFAMAVSAATAKLHRVGFESIPVDFKQLSNSVQDGDSVEFKGISYPNAEAIWKASNLILFCRNGYAKMQADPISNKKAIWVISGKNIRIGGIEFTGAKVEDKNGAGIRAEGENLYISNCFFHHNENGILGGKGILTIENSIFENNGYGDGYSHNLYISQKVAEFTLSASISRLTKIGHNLKSRAAKNTIQYNYIADETEGNSSYGIDLPNGGIGVVKGNIIQKGLKSQNEALISYGAEGVKHSQNKFIAIHNTLVSDYPGTKFIRIKNLNNEITILNNIYSGNGILSIPYADSKSNIKINKSDFLPVNGFNFYLPVRLLENFKGETLPNIPEADLNPEFQYEHPAKKIMRPETQKHSVGALGFPN